MFSWKSSANLKVVGAEGHSSDSLRQEVARGAKFVLYSYNFSIVVMSFKQPSNVHFVRPGQNRIVKGLPFSLISLVFGWWGIPWGPIYTIGSAYHHIVGGKDLTLEVMSHLTQHDPEANTGTYNINGVESSNQGDSTTETPVYNIPV